VQRIEHFAAAYNANCGLFKIAIVTPLAGQTNREVAKHLNDRHVPTARGGY